MKDRLTLDEGAAEHLLKQTVFFSDLDNICELIQRSKHELIKWVGENLYGSIELNEDTCEPMFCILDEHYNELEKPRSMYDALVAFLQNNGLDGPDMGNWNTLDREQYAKLGPHLEKLAERLKRASEDCAKLATKADV